MAQERAKVPVVNIKFERLKRLVSGGIKMNKVLDILPFVGVDIEDVGKDVIRVEYNPNRPDLSSDYGVARALRGLLDIETGLPKFKLAGRSGLEVSIEDAAVRKIRPYLIALVAKNGTLDDETLKQLIAMQEDLHNGVGRKRRKASIGIHNLDVIKFPVTYKTVSGDYSFKPLGESSEFPIYQILKDLEIGKQYGHILSAFDRYPLIVDSVGTVLSFPPIINSQATKVNDSCRNLFLEVTATDQETAEDLLAILAMTLYDAGFEIRTVSIVVDSGRRRKKIETPQIKPKVISAEVGYVNSILGLMLDTKQMITCLKKSRLDAKAVEDRKKIICTIPRYRIDISDPIDISEEVAIGYGIYNLEPKFPTSPTAGKKDSLSVYFNRIREAMIGLGMIESLNFMLTSKEVQYSAFGIIPAKDVLSVDSSKSTEHEILRDSLVPLLLQSLSYNIHEQYPQRLFEIGKTFLKSTQIIEERWSIGAVIAHTDAGYTEIKSTMQALFRSCFGKEATTNASTNQMFMEGRCAEVVFDCKSVGTLGEIIPRALENFKLRTPVVAFELNLLAIIKEDKYSTT
ncbi:MAG: phenylalanine--tRNA ligase subunit beta [Thermoproteota archaeon]|nr:phenylalanine--tRNA ligase subunit beta [Thermoproteota archaeon]